MYKNMNDVSMLWLQSDKVSNDDKEYIKSLTKQEIDTYFTKNKMVFGTAGIRSTIGVGTNQMNRFTYQQIAEGYARWLLLNAKEPIVIIGHDNRKNADLFTTVVADVLSSFDIRVLLFPNNELKATPIVSYAVRNLKADGGIMITASHNPKNYLGFKAYNKYGAQVLDSDTKKIVSLMPNNTSILNKDYFVRQELITELDTNITSTYFEACKKSLIQTDYSQSKNIPIIFTAHHGAGSYDLPNFLSSLGYNNVICVEQQCNPDPEFSFSPNSNPEDQISFELSLKYADKYKAEIMLGVDPDADRLGVVVKHNKKWKYLTGNEMGIIFTHYVLKNKQFNKTPLIISTYVSTSYIDKIAEAFKAKVIRTGTGFKWVGNSLEQNINDYDFVVAFEEAIGTLNSDINRDKDSFQAAALCLEIYNELNFQDKTLVDYLHQIYEEFGYYAGGTVSYLIQANEWKNEIEKRMKLFSKIKQKHIMGLKILDNKWNKKAEALEWSLENNIWIKFRVSGTEPKFKVYYDVNANSLLEAEEIFNSLKSEIDNILRS